MLLVIHQTNIWKQTYQWGRQNNTRRDPLKKVKSTIITDPLMICSPLVQDDDDGAQPTPTDCLRAQRHRASQQNSARCTVCLCDSLLNLLHLKLHHCTATRSTYKRTFLWHTGVIYWPFKNMADSDMVIRKHQEEQLDRQTKKIHDKSYQITPCIFYSKKHIPMCQGTNSNKLSKAKNVAKPLLAIPKLDTCMCV